MKLKLINKKILCIFLLTFLLGSFSKINAISEFPKTITVKTHSLINKIPQGEAALYKKTATFDGKEVKAYCTSFKDIQPNKNCTQRSWRTGDATKNKYVSYAVGAMLYKSRSVSGFDWDNSYFYTELAINKKLVDWGSLSEKKLFSETTKIRNNNIYNTILAIGKSEYSRAKSLVGGMDAMKITSANISKSGAITVNIKCGTSNCSKFNFTPNFKVTNKNTKKSVSAKTYKLTTNSNTAKITATADINSLVNEGDNSLQLDSNVSVKVKTHKYSNKYDFLVAQNYECGKNSQGQDYQDITINALTGVTLGKKLSSSSALVIPKITSSEPEYALYIDKKDQNNGKFLEGAVVDITKDGSTFQKNVKIEYGRIRITKNNSGDEVTPGNYCVKEVSAPDGYVVSADPQCQKLEPSSDNGEVSISFSIVDSPEPAKLIINKVDQQGQSVAGAKLKVCYSKSDSVDSIDDVTESDLNEGENEDASDETGDISEESQGDANLLDSDLECLKFDDNNYFITGDSPRVIENVDIGKTYFIIEEQSSDIAYAIAPSQSVEIKSGENTVTMVNVYSKFSVSKQDITSKKELKGATLEIQDLRGVTIQSWTSSDKPQEITGLADGDYTLVETTAPDGYKVSESIPFTIENGKLKDDEDNTLVMYDSVVVNVPDTFTTRNIITMIIGLALVISGTGVLVYEIKKKKTA